jgi:penicillin-binding protein 1B
MTIEVTSVPNHQGTLSLRRIARRFRAEVSDCFFGRRRILARSIIAFLTLLIIIATHSLYRSYRYYAQIVDTRLARGYLTSRPGLYAAPTTIRPGQALSPDALVLKLRRASYIESTASDVWSGRFQRLDHTVLVQPTQIDGTTPTPVAIAFDKDQISSITSGAASLDSFTLEPETLTNDAAVKPGARRALAYGEIPAAISQAILAIEDQRFFDHPGLDPFGLVRALLRNVIDDRVAQGGSTITQQLVKNTYLNSERTLQRKYAEAMLAFALERRLSKEDIFALYCNEIYLGQRGALAVRGVDEAARVYFGKQLQNLSLAEAATIAGMIQGPARYSPVRNPSAAAERKQLVLEAMERSGVISKEQATAAAAEQIKVAPLVDQDSLAPYFIDYVDRVGQITLEAPGQPQRLFTTIDLDLQKLAENAVKRQLEHIRTSNKDAQVPQVALVALDPHTGDVLAMIGGSDYGTSQLNRATDAHRQPGSTFKPFVYAAALEDGMSPVAMFRDAPQDFVYDRNKIYRPANFGGAYSMQEVPMRAGLVHSLNTVTVAIALRTGLARTANLTERFGLPKPARYPSLALGTSEVTPLELAAAYAIFANGGRRVKPRVVRGASEPSGEKEISGNEQSAQVIAPTTAYMITNMLSAVIDHGTARKARGLVKASAIAGKTGTSRDGWFVGYTPNLVCAVWMGFDDNSQLGLTAADSALPVWTDFMKAALARRPELGGRNFGCPEGIKFIEIDTANGLISTLTCPSRELIAVSERVAPHLECSLHGNLPESNEGEMPALLHLPTAVAAGTPTPKASLVSFEPSRFWTTRVDVDRTGRRTLVNDMR